MMSSCTGGSESVNDDSDSTEVTEQMFFEEVDPNYSGVDFKNIVTETDSFNFYFFDYMYNGAGVAVGDINNDGLEDVYFVGNQEEDKLYLNKGDFKFEDITESAIGELAFVGWHTGVTMADINADGFLDIYVSRSGKPSRLEDLENLLFINNGDLTFKEVGEEFGVNIRKPTTQSTFFDADNDGDLDLFVMNHPYSFKESSGSDTLQRMIARMKNEGGLYTDVFLRNDDGVFVDASKEAGLMNYGYGLGVSATDLNDDGWVDLYISNDFFTSDMFLINQKDGTFNEEVKERTNHISYFSMGNDVADINNDGFVDFITTDMASADHVRSKKNMGGMDTEKFWRMVRKGEHFQYMFNTLQLNNGDGTFIDIGQMAGVSKTDWSWAPLLVDFDNDGLKDLLITNGYKRDSRDNDFNIAYNEGTLGTEDVMESLELMPSTKVSNYFFKNIDGVHFENYGDKWGVDKPVNTNGAIHVDLDNDGDLDLILNNMDETASILENKLSSQNNFIQLRLKTTLKNQSGIGAQIKLYSNDKVFATDIQNAKGYESCPSTKVTIGLGEVKHIDSAIISFNGERKIIRTLTVNSLNIVDYSSLELYKKNSNQKKIFERLESIDYEHQENIVNDFQNEVLLPHKMSQLGPFMSKADVNNDGIEDLYISGSRGFSGAMYVQNSEGEFTKIRGPWAAQKEMEELGSSFVDVDNDGDMDLYVVSGSNEFKFDSPLLQDQLYINDGSGNFENVTDKWLPRMQTSGQNVTVGDYDNDGDQDIFIGGKQTPGYYPFAPRSYLLENNGEEFIDVTEKSVDLMGPGMITESVFSDFDQDGDLDLVCVGEWMPVSFFENNDSKFENVTDTYNPKKSVGWYMSISTGDFNQDGRDDYIVGNIGANNKFHPSEQYPLEIYCHDFDENGTYDIVLGKYQNGVCYPVRGRQCSTEQMPFIQEKFPTYGDFAVSDLERIYGAEALSKALHYSANNFKSIVLLSDEKNGYSQQILPNEAQFGPINSSVVIDVNDDGALDIVAAGNNFSAEVETIRYDSGRGSVLINDGSGKFAALSPSESGFLIRDDCKDLLAITIKGSINILSVSNLSRVKQFKLIE